MNETDLLSLDDDSYRHELVAGVIVAEPFPTPRHDRVRRRLERPIHTHVEAGGLGEVFGETGYVLARDPDTVRGPDLSFVSRERLSNFDDARFIPGVPDLAAGARLVWVVDPERKSVTPYRTLLAPRRLELHEALGSEDVLPGFAIPLEAISER